MAKLVFNNPKITINSVDLTDQIAQVALDMTFAEVETTAFGNTAITRVAGLGDHSFSASSHQDFASAEVEATIYPLLGTTTQITIKPVNVTTATDNPLYTFTVLVNQWAPMAGAVGDLLTADITWPVSGAITKSNS